MRLLRWFAAIAGALILVLLIAFVALRTPDIPAETLRARYASAASQFVELEPGFVVHLRDEGPPDGPVVVLLHGSNASLHTWEEWVERLGGEYRIVTIDLQGHGLTGPTPSGCYTGSCMAETVEKVRAHLGIERLAIGGNSMGGIVSIRYALAHPERVSALILVDSAGAQFRATGTRPAGFRLAGTPVLRQLAEHITPRSLIERSLVQSTSVDRARTPDRVDRYWELLRYPGNRRATLDRFASPREPFGADMLKALAATPTLILWGEEDRLFPPEAARW
ncbi:MAG: alpha/beta hydrolase, partial [Sphingomonadaceae bacterium]